MNTVEIRCPKCKELIALVDLDTINNLTFVCCKKSTTIKAFISPFKNKKVLRKI